MTYRAHQFQTRNEIYILSIKLTLLAVTYTSILIHNGLNILLIIHIMLGFRFYMQSLLKAVS